MNPTVTPALTDITTTTSVDKLFVSSLVVGAIEDTDSFWGLVILLCHDTWEGRTAEVKVSKAKEIIT